MNSLTRVVVLALAAMFWSKLALAQTQPVPPPSSREGSYIGPVGKISRIREQAAAIVGARGGWFISDSLAWGFAGYSSANGIDAPVGAPSMGPLDIRLFYGGIELEYVVYRGGRVLLGMSALAGGAATSYVKDKGRFIRSDEQVGETDFGSLFEPAFYAAFRVTDGSHLTVGVSYRLITGVEQPGLARRDLSGPAASFAFTFGKF